MEGRGSRSRGGKARRGGDKLVIIVKHVVVSGSSGRRIACIMGRAEPSTTRTTTEEPKRARSIQGERGSGLVLRETPRSRDLVNHRRAIANYANDGVFCALAHFPNNKTRRAPHKGKGEGRPGTASSQFPSPSPFRERKRATPPARRRRYECFRRRSLSLRIQARISREVTTV